MRVIRIDKPEQFNELVEPDMRRWWRQNCIIHRRHNDVVIELADRSWDHLRESVKRLASFGVDANIVIGAI